MTLTLENISSEMQAALQRKAEEQRTSVDQVALEAIKTGLEMMNARTKSRDLSDLVGKWVEDPAFDAIMQEQDRVDPEMWR